MKYNMNDYTQVKLAVIPYSETATDILAALLAEIGYESFVPDENGLTAFVPQPLYDEGSLRGVIEAFPMEAKIDYKSEFVAGRDWNEEWEKNYFKPIVIGDECVIHSTFHTDVPKARYDILIDPKMAFGTGHHETTSLIIGEILKADLKGKKILDMGCGTAVLAILAVMKGASDATAIDIDAFAYENALENIRLNHTPGIKVLLGGAEILGEDNYDVIFANINRNILLADICAYAKCMHHGSFLYMSGFYVEDIPVIREEARKYGLEFLGYEEKNRWVAVEFKML